MTPDGLGSCIGEISQEFSYKGGYRITSSVTEACFLIESSYANCHTKKASRALSTMINNKCCGCPICGNQWSFLSHLTNKDGRATDSCFGLIEFIRVVYILNVIARWLCAFYPIQWLTPQSCMPSNLMMEESQTGVSPLLGLISVVYWWMH